MSVIDKFGIDVLDIGRTFNDSAGRLETDQTWPTVLQPFIRNGINPVKRNDGSWVTYDDDGTRILSRMPVGATFFDQTYFPYVDGYPRLFSNLMPKWTNNVGQACPQSMGPCRGS